MASYNFTYVYILRIYSGRLAPNGRAAITSVLSGGTIFLALVLARRYTLRALLGYRGWMYEAPRQQSWKTLGWCVGVKLLTGSRPLLFSFQRSLPRLPGIDKYSFRQAHRTPLIHLELLNGFYETL